MSMRVFKKRCPDCRRTYLVRKPNTDIRFAKANLLAICPWCYPEALKAVCLGCRLPYALVGHHGKGLCMTCFASIRRYNPLPPLQPIEDR